MAWDDISDFKFGWDYEKKKGFVRLTLSGGVPEFIDNLEYDALNQLLDLLSRGAKFYDIDRKIITQTMDVPTGWVNLKEQL